MDLLLLPLLVEPWFFPWITAAEAANVLVTLGGSDKDHGRLLVYITDAPLPQLRLEAIFLAYGQAETPFSAAISTASVAGQVIFFVNHPTYSLTTRALSLTGTLSNFEALTGCRRMARSLTS